MALLCAALSFASPSTADWLAFDRHAVLAGEFWRLWTGHLMHFSLQHALIDAAVLFLVGAIVERELGSRWIVTALLLGAPLIGLGILIAAQDMAFYRGASALAVMLAVAAGFHLWNARPDLRAFIAAGAACFAVKTVLDATGFSLDVTDLPEGVRVAWQAHVFGGICGFCLYKGRLISNGHIHQSATI